MLRSVGATSIEGTFARTFAKCEMCASVWAFSWLLNLHIDAHISHFVAVARA